MFGPSIQQRARRIAESIVRPLAALGLTPNMATLLGLVLNMATAVVIALGHLWIGGAMLLFAGVFDMFDGALARVRNQKTIFGAFFDSTLDRFSEGIVLLGVIVYALTTPALANHVWIACLAYVAGLGSLMVSYTRARAEGLGLEVKHGLMARPERVALLTAGLIFGGFLHPAGTGLLWTLALLAVASVFTSVQRIVAVYRLLARRERPQPSVEQARTAAANGRVAQPERRPNGWPGMRAQRTKGAEDGGDSTFFGWRRQNAGDESLAPGHPRRR
jgi:CDP-diacylglycerol--glycerol-3-phosphate 3-phosphatidyltransferase